MSIRKRDQGGQTRWLVDYRDGAGARRFRQFVTRRAAEAFSVQARSEVTAGTHTPDSVSITVKEAADLWLARCERDGLEPTTTDAYRQHLDLHILPRIGVVRLSRLTAPAVNAFRDQLLDDGRSRDMTRRVLASLAALVDEARVRGLTATNAVRTVAKSKRTKRAAPGPEMPTQDELRRIIIAASADDMPARTRPLILTALLAGLRGSELRGLLWEDVDLERGELHVRRRADRFNKFGPPKSEAGTRTIPMSPMLLNTLRQWRLICPKGALGLVFPTGAGNVESHGNILNRIFWPVQITAGVTIMRDGKPDAKYSLHALRHACAALWIQQGFGPKRIQVLMGHASITQTFDRYGYLFESREADSTAMAEITARLINTNK
jgi:integrase